jgi:flagellar biosynthesis/type III secretory pathway protein FliH
MNKNNSRRKKIDEQHENAKDILDMIRARQEQEGLNFKIVGQSKLKQFLNDLKQKDESIENYEDTPIYKLGYDSGHARGYHEGYQQAYYELFKVLKAIETIIEPHVNKDC